MAWYRITYVPSIMDDLRAADKSTAQRLLDKTKWLASNVANLRQESLHHDIPGIIQYAVGDWRILYTIDAEEYLVHIHRIASRWDLYTRRNAR